MLEPGSEPRSVFVLDLAALSGSHGPLRSSRSSFHIADEESEFPLVAEPGKNTGPLFPGRASPSLPESWAPRGWAADGNGDRSGDKGVTVAGLLRRRLCLRGASEPHPLGIRRGKLYVNLEEDIHSNAQCFLFVSWGNRVYLCVGEEKRG